jgi:Fe-S oxidoreductase
MPSGHVCCGRPLYDYGFLDVAETYLHNVLDVVREYVRADVPIVGMEPSCLAVFKEEMVKMLPHDDDARRLSQNAYHWPEFFQRFDVPLPRLERKAVVWGHCHHKATGDMNHEHKLLERMGLQVEAAAGGCCGLAGSWGFEAGHHEISMRCGEEGFFPAVRKADESTLVVADGFSCKTQLAQSGSPRRALHVAQVMQMARHYGASGFRGGRPEEAYYLQRPNAPRRTRAMRVAATVAALALVGAGLTTGSIKGYGTVRRRFV